MQPHRFSPDRAHARRSFLTFLGRCVQRVSFAPGVVFILACSSTLLHGQLLTHALKVCPPHAEGEPGPDCGHGGPSGIDTQAVVLTDPADTLIKSLDQEPFLGARADDNGVVPSSGEYVLSVTDLSIPGRGFDLVFRRTYRSRTRITTVLGQGWNFNYNERMIPRDGFIEWIRGDSWSDVFEPAPDGNGFISRFGEPGRARIEPDGAIARRDPLGTVRRFDGETGVLRSITDRNGNTMRFEHQEGRIHSIIDTMGRRVRLEYEPTGLLSAIEDWGGRRVEYAYDGQHRLTEVSVPGVVLRDGDPPRTLQSRYEYDSSTNEERRANIVALFDRKGQETAHIDYGEDSQAYSFDRVTSVRHHEGASHAYSYVEAGTVQEPEQRILRVTDPVGSTRELGFDAVGNLIRRTDIAGDRADSGALRREWLFTHAPLSGRLMVVRTPEGTEELSQYHGGGGPLVDGSGALVRWPDGTPQVVEGTLDPYFASQVVARTILAGPRGDGLGGTLQPVRTETTRDPFYSQVIERTDARGQTWRWRLDYEELDCSGAIRQEMLDEAETWGLVIDEGSSLPCGAGDLNGDGVVEGREGDRVASVSPPYVDADGNGVPAAVTTTRYDGYGRPALEQSPLGIIARWEYYPEAAPHDGFTLSPAVGGRELDDVGGGYLRRSVVDDMDAALGRPAAAQPAPVAATSDTRYDTWGNQVETIDARGVITELQLNRLNRPLRIRPRAGIAPPPRGEVGLLPLETETRFVWDENLDLAERWSARERDSEGELIGSGVRMQRDSRGNVVAEVAVDAAGGETRVHHAFDAVGRRVRTVSPAGRVTRIEHSGFGEPAEVTWFATLLAPGSDATADPPVDPSADRVLRLTHDGNGNLIAEESRDLDAAGQEIWHETRWWYDGLDRPVEKRDPVCTRSRTVLDAGGYPILQEWFGAAGGISPHAPACGGIDTRLAAVHRRFDAIGRMIEESREIFSGGSPAPDSVTRFFHDADGRAAFRRGPTGREQHSLHDGAGREIETWIVGPSPASETLAAVRRVFDDSGKMLQVSRLEPASGGTWQITWSGERDAAGRLVRETWGDGPDAATAEQTFDLEGRPTRTLHPSGAETLRTHGPEGWLVFEETRLWKPDGGLLASWANPSGTRSRSLLHDRDGEVIETVDGRGNVTTLVRDGTARLAARHEPDGRIWCFDDSPGGSRTVASVRMQGTDCADPADVSLTTIRDGLGRVIARETAATPGSSILSTPSQSFEHDGLGRITRATDDNGGLAWTPVEVERAFDSAGRMQAETLHYLGISPVVESTYDAAGFRTSMKHVDLGDAPARMAAFAVDGAGRPGTMDFGPVRREISWSGIRPVSVETETTAGGRLVRHNILDARGRLTEIRYRDGNAPASAEIAAFKRALDPAGLPLLEEQLHRPAGAGHLARAYSSDSTGRLTAVREGESAGGGVMPTRHWEWTHDASGNRLESKVGLQPTRAAATATDFIDRDGREFDYTSLTWSEGLVRQSDALGNLHRSERQGDTLLFHHDALGRLVRIERQQGNDLTRVADFRHDAFGRRIDTEIAGGARAIWIWDGWSLVDELGWSASWRRGLGWLGPDQVAARHHVAVDGTPVASEIDAGAALDAADGQLEILAVPLLDFRGSTERILGATGELLERYTYTPDGRQEIWAGEQLQPVSAYSSPYGFAGHRNERFTGANLQLVFARHRIYDPEAGRFLQRDPLGRIDGDNLYAYVGNQPVTRTDPTGLFGIGLPGAGSGIDTYVNRLVAGASRGCFNCGGSALLAGLAQDLRNLEIKETLANQFPNAIRISPIHPSWRTSIHPALITARARFMLAEADAAKGLGMAMARRALKRLLGMGGQYSYDCPCPDAYLDENQPFPYTLQSFVADVVIEVSPSRIVTRWSPRLPEGIPVQLEEYFSGRSLETGPGVRFQFAGFRFDSRLTTVETASGKTFEHGVLRVGFQVDLGRYGRIGYRVVDRTQVLSADGESLRLPYIIDREQGAYWAPPHMQASQGSGLEGGATFGVPGPVNAVLGYYLGFREHGR